MTKQDEKRLYWQDQFNLYESSGLSSRQFCKEMELGYQTFLNWRRRLSEEKDAFIEIAQPKLSRIEITCGDISLQTSPDIEVKELSLLISALHLAVHS